MLLIINVSIPGSRIESQTDSNTKEFLTKIRVESRKIKGLYQIPEAVTPIRDIRISICLIQHGERRRFAMPIPLRADLMPVW